MDYCMAWTRASQRYTNITFSRQEATSSNMQSMTPGLTCSQDDSSHQLEDGQPASFRDMNNTDEHYFIESDITTSNPPVAGAGWDRNALAVLNTDQFPRLIATFGTNVPTKIA